MASLEQEMKDSKGKKFCCDKFKELYENYHIDIAQYGNYEARFYLGEECKCNRCI